MVQCMSDTHTHTHTPPLYNQRLEVGQTRKSRVRFLARLRNRYIQYSVLAKQRGYRIVETQPNSSQWVDRRCAQD